MADAMAERTSPATLRSQPDFDASPTYLTSALPPRAGQRPRTESCLPHAQMEAESPDDIFEALTNAAAASLGKDVVQGPTTVSVPSKCEDLKTTVASTTDAGGLAGTWAFMAPELLRNRRFTEKSDVYSFAFVVWEVHDRGQPWDGLQQPQIITQVLVEHARPRIPDMPRDLRDLMVRAWSDDPDGRPTFADAVKELQGTIPRQRPPYIR